ncbi:MAG: hypothetical protein ABEK42_01790, partial [Thiohalorhabdaceae bacterium]
RAGGANLYATKLTPPVGAQGVTIRAIAFDRLGQEGASQTVRVGQVRDTVEPELEVLSPPDGGVLPAGYPLTAEALVGDIGDPDKREVSLRLVRE